MRQNLGLLTCCKAIYLEAHPLYLSLVRLVLKNTYTNDIPAYLQSTILPKIQCLEIDWEFDRSFMDWSLLPALQTVTFISISRYHTIYFTRLNRQAEEEYVEGLRDSSLIQQRQNRDFLFTGVFSAPRYFQVHDTAKFEFGGPRRAVLVCTYQKSNIFE